MFMYGYERIMLEYDLAIERMDRQRKEIEHQQWDIDHMRSPAIEADLDWRVPIVLAYRKAVEGDL